MSFQTARRRALRRATRAVVLVSAVAVVAGCGGSSNHGGSYPASAKASFLGGCEQRASTAQCTCELAHIQSHISFSTFTAADKALANHTGGIPAWLLNAARACAAARQTTTTT